MILPKTVAWFLALANAATVPNPISLEPLPLHPVSDASSLLQNNTSKTTPHLPNDILFYHIPGTTLDLYIRDVGSRMPITDILPCLRTLSDRIVDRITAQGEAALSVSMSHRHGVVAIIFTPLKLTWVKAGIIIGTVETLIQHDNWTYASHITIEDSHEGVVVGYLNIRYHGTDPDHIMHSSPSPSPSHSNSNSNTPSSPKTNLTTQPPRPPSPYPYVIPNSQIHLQFSHFGPKLPLTVLMTLFLDAQIYISMRVRILGPLALVIDSPEKLPPWKLGGVVLEFFPGRRMRWYDLMVAMEGVVDFVGSFGGFAFRFEVRWEGWRDLGGGEVRGGS